MKRRTVISGLAAAAPSLIGLKAHAAPGPFDPNNRAHVLNAVRKLAYTADDKLTYFWSTATRLGVVDSAFTPFWQMNIGYFHSVKDSDDGGFDVSTFSAIFYTDLETGKFIETFRNPYTGKTVQIRYLPPRALKRHYASDGEHREPVVRPGMKVTAAHNLGPAWVQGDHLWVRMDSATRIEPEKPGAGKLSQVNDWSTYSGSLKQVADPDVKNPPSMWIFNDINTWPEWLEMGDIQGNYVSRGVGHKAYSWDEMPTTWKEIMKLRAPEAARDPAGALKG